MTTDSTANRKHIVTPPGESVLESLASRSGVTRRPQDRNSRTPARMAGEMVQQTIVAARDSDCFPQGFVRLVGHRHSDSRPFSWITARPLATSVAEQASADEASTPIG